MLTEEARTAILQLHERGSSLRAIARVMNASRTTIKKVLASGSSEVPALARPSQGDAWHEDILKEHARLKGRLVLVHRALVAKGARFSYQALTAYCRRHGIGVQPKVPSGSYTFELVPKPPVWPKSPSGAASEIDNYHVAQYFSMM